MPVDFAKMLAGEKEKFTKSAFSGRCLWPYPYEQDTVESAVKFCLNLRTWNEAEGKIQPMPKLPHLFELTKEWFHVKQNGGVLVCLKARRMVVSWWCRGLELHQLGLARRDWLLGGEKYLPACKHVWRLHHFYQDLQKRYPSWGLADMSTWSFEGPKALKQIMLPNGSTCNAINGEGSNIQGEGIYGVTFEEASLYPHLQTMLGQAKIVTEARPGFPGGFITLIANPEHNYEFQQIVDGGD